MVWKGGVENLIIKGNYNLEARFSPVKNSAKRGILIAHSFRNDMNEIACTDAERIFQENSFSTLTFNFLAHGKSEGNLRHYNNRTTAENIESGVKFLNENGCHKIGIYAISRGTISSVCSDVFPEAQVFVSPTPLYTPKGFLRYYDPDKDKITLESEGYFMAKSGSGRGYFEMGSEFIEEMQDMSSDEILHRHISKKVPTLILQGDLDGGYKKSINEAKKFVDEASNQFIEIEGADHNFTQKPQRHSAIGYALDFFEKHL